MPKDVVISVPKNDPSFAEALENDPMLDATRLPGAGMDGGGEFLVFLVPLAHFTVKALIDLVKAHWQKAKSVKFEVDGMRITGASLDEISDFLEKNFKEHDSE